MKADNKMVYVVVRDPGDVRVVAADNPAERFIAIRGVYETKEAAQAWVQHLWDSGERPQARVESYFLRES